ncbi:MAG: hypothetical protein IPJ30_15070 [Acidobacteria bacterium]|nr:hypothetical protein [Acidobacteriota bacterium]
MKNPRAVFGIVAFVVAFVFSVGLVRIFFPAPFVPYAPVAYVPHHRHSGLASELESFIERDKSNGSYREDAILISNVVSVAHAESVKEYWETSSSMDARNFPRDFRFAWKEHMNAWYEFSEFLNARKGKKVDRAEFNLEAARLDAEISRTWDDVLDAARAHGAHVH